MGNGLNIGGASGTVQDLAPLISPMMGQTTVMGNGLNLGRVTPPAAAATSAKVKDGTGAKKPAPEAARKGR